jgi:ubiquinone/menaquinone biosynthesis C-methylase UbiE
MTQESSQEFAAVRQKMSEREAQYLSFGYDVKKERRRILDAAGLIQGEILEAGTGKGYFSLVLAKKGHRFVSFDLSEEAREIARLHLRSYGLDSMARFVIENGESLSFKDQSFGTVFSVNTLHHLENPLKVIDELIRVLAPSGKLVLCDFSDEGFSMMEKIHVGEGSTHESGEIRLVNVESYLKGRGFETRTEKSVFQEILIAVKPL